MSVQFDNLTKEVREMKDQVDAGTVALRKLSRLIVAGKDDPVKMQALADELDAKATEMAAAIVETDVAE